jgi:hypothetical protein
MAYRRGVTTMLRPLSVVSLLLAAACTVTGDPGTIQDRAGPDTGEDEGDGGDGGGDDEGKDDEDDDEGKGDGDRDDCKVEGEDIGSDVALELGSVVVTFGHWIAKADSPGEYVGFTIALEGADAITYRVKAGGEVFEGTAPTWVHPAGTSGPEAKGISNVDMCEDDEDGDGGDGDDGDGDGDDDGGDGDDDGGDVDVQ